MEVFGKYLDSLGRSADGGAVILAAERDHRIEFEQFCKNLQFPKGILLQIPIA
jgi:hypothetical protein